jgi:thiol-disulfide isomerase/thioredoxin
MRHLVIVPIALILLTGQQIFSQNKKCIINGTLVNRTTENVRIVPGSEDMVRGGVLVPVVNNHFSLELNIPYLEEYYLIPQDDFVIVGFFPDNDTVEITLSETGRSSETRVKGGALNQASKDHNAACDEMFTSKTRPYSLQIDSLYKAGNYYSDKVKQLLQKIVSTEEGLERDKLNQELSAIPESEKYSQEVISLMDKCDSVNLLKLYWNDDQIRNNINLFSYSLLFNSVKEYRYNKKAADLAFVNDIFPLYRKKFPEHIYTAKIAELLNSFNQLKVGDKYIDFQAPTIDGKIVKISDSISGKVALIDLWASWCLPCRRLSISMIPIYEKFRSKGFVIIGVACEYKTVERFQETVINDKYPWLNLVELNNQNKIWSKYGVSGAGGNTFLIDETGTIIAIHPDAKQLEILLNERLK